MINLDDKKFGKMASIIRRKWLKKIIKDGELLSGEGKLSKRKVKLLYWKIRRLGVWTTARRERRFIKFGCVFINHSDVEAGVNDCKLSNPLGFSDVVISNNNSGNMLNVNNVLDSSSGIVLDNVNMVSIDNGVSSFDGEIGLTNHVRRDQVLFMGYNVRTLAECSSYESVTNTLKPERLQELTKAIHMEGIMCCAVMEVRRKGVGVIPLDFGYTFYYSGGKEKIHGVGFIIKNGLMNDLKVVNVSDRIMFLTGSIGNLQLSLGCLYAPTHGNGDDESMRIKESFFDDVSEAYDKLASCFRVNTMMFIDSNSHIGSYSIAQKKLRGPFVGEGQVSNKSGILLFNFCAKHDLILGNTYFKKDEYWTWELPGTTDDDDRLTRRFTLDFCLVSTSLQHLMLSCGVDINIDMDMIESDHRPVVINMLYNYSHVVEVKSKSSKRSKSISNDYDYGKLRCDSVRVLFEEKLEEQNINEVYNINQLISTISNVRQHILPIKQKCRVECWMKGHESEIRNLILERRIIRRSWLLYGKNNGHFKDLYAFSKKYTRQRLRTIKNTFFVHRSISIQKSFDSKNPKEFFRAMNNFVSKRPVLIPDQIFLKGNTILTSSPEERIDRVGEHFEDLLNQTSVIPENIEQFLPEEATIEWALQDPFTIKELSEAIYQMSRDKSCGPDGLPIEILQSLGPSNTWNKLLSFFNEYLESGEVPNELKDVIISPLYKKDDSRCMDNYRGISLISHHGKLLEKLVTNRLTSIAEKRGWLPESQNGFRENRSTVHSIFVSRMLASLCREKGVQLSKVYIDFVKAYDKVNQELLWVVLTKRGVPPKLVQLIKSFHKGSMASVKIDGILSKLFELKMGLKQGSVIAPLLFNIFLGAIIENIHERVSELGVKLKFKSDSNIFDVTKLSKTNDNFISDISIWNILFADDAEIVSDSPENLKMIIDVFSLVSSAYGQEISIKKSEVMFVDVRHELMESIGFDEISVHGQILKVVKEFKYLGSIESSKATCSLEIESRIQKSIVSFEINRASIFDNPFINRFVALSMYKVMVLTVLLYGCESWVLSSTDVKNLERFQYRTLKKILKISTRDRISHVHILMLARRYGVEIFPVEIIISKRRLIFLGQIECLGPSNMCYQVIHADVTDGSRTKGNISNYRCSIRSDLNKFGIDTKEWSIMAKQSKKWICSVNRGFNLCFRSWIFKHMSYTIPQEGDILNKDGSINVKGLKLRTLAKAKLDDILISLRCFIHPTDEEISNRVMIGSRPVRDRGSLHSSTYDLTEDLSSLFEYHVVEEETP